MDKNDIVKEIKVILEDVIIKSIDPKPEDEELSDEDISKSYESDNPDEDKWDNIEKACWSGYKQVGMKEKNGKKVPNCVPIDKSYHEAEKPKKKEIKKSIWDGSFLK
jgi:hypothetical protein